MDREINKETRVIDRSTMKRSEYITWHLFYIIVGLVLANRLLFVTLPRLSAIQSRLILVFIIILISLVLSIPRWKRNRTQIAVIEDVIIGLGMYIITAYWRFYKNWFTIIIIIVSFIIFTVSVCVWLPKYKGQHIFNIENRCTKKRVVKSRFLRMSNLTSLIITVCMLILSGPIIYNKLFYGGIKASTINNDYVVDRGDNSRHLDEYKDELKILIYEDLWKDASVNERLNVAQILADCEVNKLGMSKIKVIISEMPTDDYLSGYDEASKTMYINKEFLLSSSSSDLYTIILHEAYLQNGFGEKIEAAILSKELEKNTNKMMIIGLNGSAGTGKSTTAVSIAAALQRNFIKINVGGAGGAEIIKGVNKTVHNAGPSMIVKELAKSGHGCYSDVIILDEVDKAEPGFFNALYEFLDPNEEFIYDQYLECHIPKNNFLVVLTFNDSSCIPLPIKDRMEIVEYSNYSIQDKKMIVANYILPKLKKKFGIGRLTIDDDALDLYAYHYDVIPGMRSAERDFEFILMSIARSGSGRFSDIVNIDKKLIMGVLGKMRTSGLNDIPPCSVGKFGMAQALAITSEGIGVSTAVETVINPYQEKNIVVTGLLEGSCLESVSVACCFVNNYIQKELPKLHIHMTDAVRKDGPSAGITIVMSILSCMLGKTIPNVAFTGSIDLYGNIGPVGGVFEKCIAAERTSVDKVIVPSECYRSLVDRKEIERFPGNYVNFALGTIGIKGILKLMEDKEKRECSFVQCLAYYDGEDEPRIFYGKHQGHITYEERGVISKDDWSELSLIFIPEGEWNTTGRTLAELTHEERVRITRDNDNSAFAKFRDWYLNTMKK